MKNFVTERRVLGCIDGRTVDDMFKELKKLSEGLDNPVVEMSTSAMTEAAKEAELDTLRRLAAKHGIALPGNENQ